MIGLFGPLFTDLFGPFFGYQEEASGVVTITGQLDMGDGSGYFNTFIIRQIAGIVNYDGKQIIRKDIYVVPDSSTGVWSVNLYPADYYFIFKSGQSIIKESKTVPEANSSYEDLEDYIG